MASRSILSKVTPQLWIAFGLICFAVAARFLPHPPNFSPVAAVALFSGSIFSSRWSLAVPLVIMVVSDMLIGLHPMILYTWGSFLLIAIMARGRLEQDSVSHVVGGSIAAAGLFFLITNFGVWAQGGLYAPTLQGLLDSYYNALPFFRNTVLGNLFYAPVLFVCYATITQRYEQTSRTANKSLI